MDISSLRSGQVIDNQQLASIFKCAPQGGMRRSLTTNSLVLVTHADKTLYNDRWEGEILHYTGMGQSGDQSLEFQQNKTLNNSNHSDIKVYLFEVFKEKEYTFHGEVKLIGDLYQELQDGADGASRKVWIFPIKVIDQNWHVPKSLIKETEEKKEKKLKRLSDQELLKRAKEGSKKASTRKTSEGTVYIRNQYVKALSLRMARGICQLCDQPAPFKDKQNNPYLEVHHIEWLSRGGDDSIENTIALCPNCHKKMHVLDEKSDVNKLKLRNNELLLLSI
ncbi:HNH endonuclease [Bacillus sp. FJAT-52991]|uniref:HNH endonuclease n=1 Tax=Bacillus kandeliae TaxID=3129297 RepID=A0ABZ2N2V3_9BACI